MKRSAFVLIFTVLLLVGCATQPKQTGHQPRPNPEIKGEMGSATTPDDFGLNGVKLGDTPEQVKQSLGEPDEQSIPHGIGIPVWIYKQQGLHVAFRVENGNPLRVIYILTMQGFAGQTHRGIVIGSSEVEVLKAYGPLRIDRLDTHGLARITEGDKSIEFGFSDGKLTNINIKQGM